ncbi:hypothetical protein RI129_011320 [Pyrocoelia pectoralis]|uniref:Small ribosomal subunit protein mS29 n=1 Tax=Pyrocoelia pectoralis TaxID=417401 RepID=A0AAN7V629_9COLE
MLKSLLTKLISGKPPLPAALCQTAHFSTQPQPQERLQSFRSSENNPLNHKDDHIGLFYTITSDVKKQLFLYGGLPKTYQTQLNTFNETCLMIRKPSVDIINCLKQVDYSNPVVRYVVYGAKGNGKSLTLAHIIHYGYEAGFLILHLPWVGNWMRRCRESSISEFKPGSIDINLDAAAWLVHFKHQNSHLLANSDLRTTQDHVWSKRESTPKDAPLSELVEHGINRIKFASQCIVILAEEIKRLSTAGKCKTLVVVDGFNAFFYPHTRILTEKKEVVHPKNVTVTEAFSNLTKFDWTNGAVVVAVDEIAIAEKDQISHLPRYLLGRDGFDHMDPFVPVSVPTYTKVEFQSCMDYYRERRWVLPLDGQDEELQFLSAMNPYRLMILCNSA